MRFMQTQRVILNFMLGRAYPAPLGRAGVGSIPANPRRTKRAFFPPLAIWNEA